jgi:hypothetical protein
VRWESFKRRRLARETLYSAIESIHATISATPSTGVRKWLLASDVRTLIDVGKSRLLVTFASGNGLAGIRQRGLRLGICDASEKQGGGRQQQPDQPTFHEHLQITQSERPM